MTIAVSRVAADCFLCKVEPCFTNQLGSTSVHLFKRMVLKDTLIDTKKTKLLIVNIIQCPDSLCTSYTDLHPFDDGVNSTMYRALLLKNK
jgi:hypothetical protein